MKYNRIKFKLMKLKSAQLLLWLKEPANTEKKDFEACRNEQAGNTFNA
jgi:hypothetical protein